jgi:hypothetical protein
MVQYYQQLPTAFSQSVFIESLTHRVQKMTFIDKLLTTTSFRTGKAGRKVNGQSYLLAAPSLFKFKMVYSKIGYSNV